MADHLQTQILNNLVTTLTGATDAAARVFKERPDPLQADELPGILIEPVDEGVAMVGAKGQSYRQDRNLRIHVDIVVAAKTGYGDAARQIGKQVELAVAADPTLNNTARGLVKVVAVGWAPDGDTEINKLRQRIVLQATYHTHNDSPDTTA